MIRPRAFLPLALLILQLHDVTCQQPDSETNLETDTDISTDTDLTTTDPWDMPEYAYLVDPYIFNNETMKDDPNLLPDDDSNTGGCLSKIGAYYVEFLYGSREDAWNEQLYTATEIRLDWYTFQDKGIYPYNGTIRGLHNQSHAKYLLSVPLATCEEHCGTKPEYDQWDEVQETLANWILPILGILVGLPYESNKFMASMMLLFRWIGNPITCFSIILWNLRVSAKCGKLADMAESRETFDTFISNGGKEPSRSTLASTDPTNLVSPPVQPVVDLESQVETQPDYHDDAAVLISRPITAQSNDPAVTGNTLRSLDNGSTPGPTPPPKSRAGSFHNEAGIRGAQQTATHAQILQRRLTQQLDPDQNKVEPNTNITTFSYSPVIGPPQPQETGEEPGSFWDRVFKLEERITQRVNRHAPPSEEDIPLVRKYPASISEIRDSLYLLSIINQFETHDATDQVLWYALFTPKPKSEQEDLDYVHERTRIVEYCRGDRKRGVVAMMGAQLWFFVSFILNVRKAFTDSLGSNHVSHALGMGIFLSWLPLLAIATIVDRNSVHTEEIRASINTFLGRVRVHHNLQGAEGEHYLNEFAGQGRRKFHYGIADKTLELLERRINYLQVKASGILDDEKTGYRKLERGWSKFYDSGELVDEKLFEDGAGSRGLKWQPKEGPGFLKAISRHTERLRHKVRPAKEHRDLRLETIDEQVAFDLEEFWQILLAAAMVLMPLWGGFTISYHTPNVGLSCKSGSYLIYNILVITVFALEIAGWLPIFKRSRKAKLSLKCVMTFFEFSNFVFFVYLLCALTIGSYNTCACKAAKWGQGRSREHYVIFTPEDYKWLMPNLFNIWHWWLMSTLLAAIPLFGGVCYSLLEWCLQSHLWSGDAHKARHGLMMVRTWRSYTRWIYALSMKLFVRLPYRIVMWRKLKYPFEWRSWKAVPQNSN